MSHRYDLAAFIDFCIQQNVLRFGQFTLKSGRVSPYFFNSGLFHHGKDMAQLGEFYAKYILDKKLPCEVLFGPAYKGIPLAASTAIALYHLAGENKAVCYNRKEAKDHGEKGNFIGAPLQGNVLILDDVITAGTAFNEVYPLIQAEENARITGLLIAFDRQEKGQNDQAASMEITEKTGCPVFSLLNFHTLLAFIKEDSRYQQYVQSMQAYYAEYGALQI